MITLHSMILKKLILFGPKSFIDNDIAPQIRERGFKNLLTDIMKGIHHA